MKTEFKREMNRNYMVLHRKKRSGILCAADAVGKQDQRTSAVSGKKDRWGDIPVFLISRRDSR